MSCVSCLYNHIPNIKSKDSKVSKSKKEKSNSSNAKHAVSKQKDTNLTNFRASRLFKLVRTNRAATRKLLSQPRTPVVIDNYLRTSAVDVKSDAKSLLSREMKVLEDEYAMLRTMARTSFGTKNIRINLYEIFLSNASAGGIVDSALTIDPSTLTEFVDLADLFDEYRVVGATQHLSIPAAQPAAASANPLVVVGYDPADGAVPGSLLAVCQLEQHFITHVANFPAASAVATINDRVHVLKWHVPNGVIIDPTVASNWQITKSSGPQLPYGWIKSYISGLAANNSALVSIVTHHCEFRCRT